MIRPSTALFRGGPLGMAVYGRSGELAATPGREIAVLLSVSSALGALLGSQLNALLAGADFGLLLSGFISEVGGTSSVSDAPALAQSSPS